jgi:hypothetical protein
MTNWKNRDSDPPSKYIIPICDFLGITPYVLLTGEERAADAEPLTPAEKEVLSSFRALDVLNKGIIIGELRTLLRQNNNDNETAEEIALKERKAG